MKCRTKRVFCGCWAWLSVWLMAAAGIAAAVAADNVEARGGRRLNVLFIAVDDLRPELGCYGARHVISPHIDRLAERGVLFERAYCQQAVCNPSRVSVLTGLRPDSAKVWDLVTNFRNTVPDVVTLPQHFKQQGYFAVGMGKVFHNTFPDPVSWSVPQQPRPAGYAQYSQAVRKRLARRREAARRAGMTERQIANRIRGPATDIEDVPDNKRFDGALCELALDQLRRAAAQDKPFFLAVGFILPHLPWTPPKRYWDMYDRSELPLAPNGFLPKGMPAVAFGDRSLGGMYELMDCVDFNKALSPFEGSLSEADQRRLRHGYYASITFIDAQVGRLLAELDRLGLGDETVVVLWGDHGWKLGEHNGWCKQTNFEVDTRSPLIIAAPQARGNGRRCPATVEFLDIYPTLCELAGLSKPGRLEGTSLAPLLDDPDRPWNRPAFSQFPRRHHGRPYMGYAMRTDRYRYVEWIDRRTGLTVATELYDHQTDPPENQNLAHRPANWRLVRELRRLLWGHLKRPEPIEPPPADVADPSQYRVQPPPADWHVDPFYTKAIAAGGYPIVASERVSDYALKEAAYLVNRMLAHRPDVRDAMIRSGSRLCILAHDEFTTDLPEFAHMKPKDYWDARARGTGGSRSDPYCSCGEENLLGYPGDPYATECILLHEFAHNIHLRGLANVDPTFDRRLKETYEAAMRRGLWKGKYAAVNHHEYFAEGVQSWFGSNRENDHDHNHVNTRRELIAYDPGLAAICHEVFGDDPWTYTKPVTRLHGHLAGYDPAKTPRFQWPERLKAVHARIVAEAKARERRAREKSPPDKGRTSGQPALNGVRPRGASKAPDALKPSGGSRPNVLMIAVDDLNDWLGCLGGHPQAKTPHIDRLAASGVLFSNAYAPAASCNPSRSAILSGIAPHRSGLYNNLQKMRQVMPDAELIPKYFSRHGYWSAGSGKILHYFIDAPSWDEYFPPKETENPFPRTFYPKKRPVSLPYEPWMYVECDWAALDVTLDQYGGDWLVAKWIGEQIQQRGGQPFFLACGIYRPHLPWFVPKEYYEQFPLDEVQLPPGVKENDLDDLPAQARRLAADRYLPHIRKYGKWREGVQAYLASIAFADDMVGRVLEALERSPARDNTIVILWSDHGWHLGEKSHWRKFTGWRVCDRVPLIVRVPRGAAGLPGGTPAGAVCSRPVSLLDLFKTLNELCGLPAKEGLDGRSLAPLLSDPETPWPHPAVTYFGGPERYAISTERWRYIHYPDGGEELYDIQTDRYEWTNLAGNPKYQEQLAKMRALVPRQRKPIAQKAPDFHKGRAGAGAGLARTATDRRA